MSRDGFKYHPTKNPDPGDAKSPVYPEENK